MKFSLDSIKDNPGRYASIQYAKNMYKGTASSYSSTPSKSDVEKVNPSNLYEYYKKLFDGTYRIDVIAFGENICNIEEILDKKFKSVVSSKEDIKISIKHKYSEEVKESPVKEKKEPEKKVTYHTVEAGDNLTRISKLYYPGEDVNMHIARIVDINKKTYPRISKNYICVGWRLEV